MFNEPFRISAPGGPEPLLLGSGWAVSMDKGTDELPKLNVKGIVNVGGVSDEVPPAAMSTFPFVANSPPPAVTVMLGRVIDPPACVLLAKAMMFRDPPALISEEVLVRIVATPERSMFPPLLDGPTMKS